MDARPLGTCQILPYHLKRQRKKAEQETPTLLLCSKNRDGMEPEDLLCSRNARSQTPLVGRAGVIFFGPSCSTTWPPTPIRVICSTEALANLDARSLGPSLVTRLEYLEKTVSNFCTDTGSLYDGF